MTSRLPLVFITLTILIDGIGIGLIFPVMPDLIRELTGRDLSEAAIWGGVLATSYAVMQFFFGPVVGSLSDRFGRKPVLISALAILALDYLIMAMAHTIWLLLLGRLLAGITAATQSTASAFMADISSPGAREKNFGLVHAAMGIGFALGPLIGGLLAGIDTRAPFYAAAILAGGNAVFGLIVMPESLAADKRRAFALERANPFAAFRAIGALGGVFPLLVVFGLYQVAYFVYPAIWAFFAQAQFSLDTPTIGLTLFVFGVSMGISQAFLVGPLTKRFGAYAIVLAAIVIDVAAFVCIGFATSVAFVWLLTVVTGVSSIAMPALQAIMSRAAPDNRQGELQGVLGSIAALATIISPLLMTETFAIFAHPDARIHLPGAPFLIAALLTAACFVILVRWRRRTGGNLR
ncbi:TCR/Tet family MFS transporter [Celeribacter sp.]|uniref:TCR/Tet family MFS transporter n=1 Tax=Celeribacter sp. TaxID=1890673 RepID=UPI003A90F365